MSKFIWFKTTDYEYALNKVAPQYGGGTEVWRLESPGMPRKHFFPRQPRHPLEGPVERAKLKMVQQNGLRLVECAIPWSEIPDVRKLMEAGQPLKFSFRVNRDSGDSNLELACGRSAAEGLSCAFHPDWVTSWPNELEFGWEK